MKIIIIDDEELARSAISACIENIPEVELAGVAYDVASGIRTINETKPDLVLLDIKMPDGTGFDLLDQIDVIDFDVIFITAYEEYAIKAFEFSALHYLVKPLDMYRLIKVIKETLHRRQSENLKEQLEAAANMFKSKARKIVLKTVDSVLVVPFSDIIRCEADINYTNFYFTDGGHLLVSKTLKEFEKMLVDYGFFRVHKRHLINTSFLKKIERKKPSYAILTDGSKIPIAMRKREVLISILEGP